MTRCPTCSHTLTRSHRNPLQKVIYAHTLRCSRCGYRGARLHAGLGNTLHFVFSRCSRCIRCGTIEVQRTARRDLIDSMSGNLVSVLLGLTGAPLNKCSACRLQYRDWRSPRNARPPR
jgi:hypothetical protein